MAGDTPGASTASAVNHAPRRLRAALDLLRDKRSPKRRAGAKKLRELADPAAGPALLDVLRIEIKDPRTWETQYQMIIALGSSAYEEALPLLRELARARFEATSIYVALGDAIVRLARKPE
jgi:HEAT repeat protein